MRWAGRRWVRRLGVAAVVAVLMVALGLLGGRWWLRTGLPSYDGTLIVTGLSAPVRIDRDGRAIPRIYARTMDDAYLALGYAHAQDRLWQMDMMRRYGAGRLAEIFPATFGDWAVRSDISMRTLGLYRLAEASYRTLAPEVRRGLDAYAAGVNAFLTSRQGPLPLEFQLLGYQPEPWRPADSLVWGKLLALQLSGNMREELFRARLSARFSADEINDLLPADSEGAPVTLAGELAGGQARQVAGLIDRVAAAVPEPLGPDLASNEWVVAGSATDSGKPVLANDPHLGLQAPILWYLARIETPELTLSGATVPGVPFHILGHNGTIAWGMTNTHSDTQDIFVERLLPDDPSRYQTPAGPRMFETRSEVIRVRGRADRTVTVRATRHGPVLPEDSPLANTKATPGLVLALAFTGLSENDTSAEAIYRLNRARGWDDFTAALRFHQSPQQNIVYADTGGTIGFLAPGLVPVRAKGRGVLPAPGWTGDYDWSGMVPFDALPRAVNPPAGRFVNANNAVVGPDYPYLLTARWPDSFRASRITQLLDQDVRPSVASSVAMQLDVVSLPARRLIPLMLPRPGTDTQVLSRTAQAAVALLRRWDGTAARDRPEPLIFSWWLREFNRALFAERLGPLFSEYWGLRPLVIEHVLNGAPSWCDQLGAPGTRTCRDVLRTTLETTVRTLAERYGDKPARWQWGREHVAPLDHPLLSRLPVLGWWFGIGVATDGDGSTLNQGGGPVGNDARPFADVHGPGLRAVYDLSNLDRSQFMIATGQSGNPLSPHYRDLVRSWRDGALVALAATATVTATDSVSLVPRPH